MVNPRQIFEHALLVNRVAAKFYQDTAEDIAVDVLSRMDSGMNIRDAFKDIDYLDLYNKTREADMPNGWESKPEREKLKLLIRVIEKGMHR